MEKLFMNGYKLYLVLLGLMYQQLPLVAAVDRGYGLLFTTNAAEYTNMAVRFTGEVPGWLNGRLIRNGIGKMEMGGRIFGHMLDGYGKLSGFTFNGSNTALFSTKFVATKFYKDSLNNDDIAPYLLFDEPNPSFSAIGKALQKYNAMDNTNINVHAFKSPSISSNKDHRDKNGQKNPVSSDNDYLAVSDFWQSNQFDPNTLDTISYVNPDLPTSYIFGNRVPLPSTSHPVREHNSQSYISFVSYLSMLPFVPNYINVIRIKSTMEREAIATIQCDRLSYMHSIGLSKNYAIVFADPLYLEPLNWFHKVTLSDMLVWEPTLTTKVHIINIHTGKVLDLEVPAKIHMHHVNSYESGDQLVIDYIVHRNFNTMKQMSIKSMFNRTARNAIDPGCRLIRYRINLKTMHIDVISFMDFKVKSGDKNVKSIYNNVKYMDYSVKSTDNTVKHHQSMVNKMDFPAINPNYLHRPYCYIYGFVAKTDNVNFAKFALVKKDLCMDKNRVWYREDHYPSEPVFVPSPDGASEDDGVVLSVILNGRTQKSYLGIFDAKTLNIIATGYLEDHIPYTLHGGFYQT